MSFHPAIGGYLMDITPTQKAILVDLLLHNDDKAGNIARRTGRHRNSVSRSFQDLLDAGFVQEKGGGVYRLTDRGRESAIGLVKPQIDVYEA
ncbi:MULTISPECIES: helix-turn-helix domain-containing protein [Halobacteriales]|uniref:Transcription regulator TrmB N-terminal domain-containing protein n=5 Tax=Halobacteriales TaxID=2235 RepID=M0C1U8_9EURY|nr:helix-turn-helix domain-containing protein [Halorubrum californiense]ELY86461.1 hypothetical protein C483_19555 [Natrialba hulunbeirensis JCM 10989]ELZ16312.1 hypothetical protein C476_17092 [Natrinema limicola JCM 13563]EMA25437.1 hypothetical protein C443_03029 [Haloarcula argentinensis DSM 12282]EMA56873.1 hypothetical protein C451_00065 [Halococcus thailandensis JCM 13552]UVW56703.1 putative Transcriptional regulator [Haloferax volcanii pleomorphic virus 1]